MRPLDLIAAAKDLCAANARKPRQVNLRRAVSTTYYALFHTLARCCADTMIGKQASKENRPEWRRVYRALDHASAKRVGLNEAELRNFSRTIRDFADFLVEMQEKRHKADYDPGELFYKDDVTTDIGKAQKIVKEFEESSIGQRRAFASLVLFKDRK